MSKYNWILQYTMQSAQACWSQYSPRLISCGGSTPKVNQIMQTLEFWILTKEIFIYDFNQALEPRSCRSEVALEGNIWTFLVKKLFVFWTKILAVWNISISVKITSIKLFSRARAYKISRSSKRITIIVSNWSRLHYADGVVYYWVFEWLLFFLVAGESQQLAKLIICDSVCNMLHFPGNKNSIFTKIEERQR